MALEVINRKAEHPTQDTPILFVHGAWHAAWCWDEFFLPYFAQQGFDSHALSLGSHGKSHKSKAMNLYGVWDYVRDVAQVAYQIEQKSEKRPIVIGHSMGGYVVQKYLEQHIAPAAVLVASIPVMGTIPLQMRLMRDHSLAFVKTSLTLNPYHLVSPAPQAKTMFFSDSVPMEQVTAYHAKLQTESLRILLDAGIVNRPHPDKIKPTPMMLVAAKNDKVFTVEEEEATAKAYKAPIKFYDMAHDMMLEPGWQSVADDIIAWLSTQSL